MVLSAAMILSTLARCLGVFIDISMVCLTNTRGRRANTWSGGANHWKVLANPWRDLGHSPVPRPTGSVVSVVGGSTAGTPGTGGPGVPAPVGGSLACQPGQLLCCEWRWIAHVWGCHPDWLLRLKWLIAQVVGRKEAERTLSRNKRNTL